MIRPIGVLLLLLLCGSMTSDAPSGRREVEQKICTIPLTKTLRIPVSTLGAQDTPESLAAAPASLMISPGAADETPDGPRGFDVLDDGSVLITDPLRSRVSFFDSHGEFRKVWKIGFPADSLTVIANGVVLVREASTGKFHAFDREGRAHSSEDGAPPEQPEARVLSGRSGTVRRPAIGSAHGGPLAVQFDRPGLTLLSLEVLGIDQQGDTYVALETTANRGAAESIDLNKYVRRYSSDGSLLCEIADIRLDYYVPPVDELRVHKGMVYQMLTTSSEVRINVWDTNQLCSQPSH
jgi:hypothetical protein